ncbi:MAG TPA: hypothetical protein VFG81_15010 [Anaerolineales bacterium]|jgi:hypothetical protein|nr:hypothetical protein [Anaerolineales bacterium]
MQRREFLKLAGTFLGSTVLLTRSFDALTALPVEARFKGRHFRGYRNDGDIFVSEDNGETWQLHTRLGSEYSIDDLFVNPDDQMYAGVGFMHYHFQLFLSEDGKQWITA